MSDLLNLKDQPVILEADFSRRKWRKPLIFLWTVLILAALAGLWWLNYDCPAPLYTGILTWNGKECLQ